MTNTEGSDGQMSNRIGHFMSITNIQKVTKPGSVEKAVVPYNRDMGLTEIFKYRPRRLYIKEWQKWWGISSTTMAARIGIQTGSYHRWLRDIKRLGPHKLAAIADAMGHEMEPSDFYRPPSIESADAILRKASPDVRETALDIVRRLVQKSA